VPTSPPSVPAFLRALVDDTAVLPPASVPLDEALRDHAAHRASSCADLVGAFVVPDSHLPRLAEQPAHTGPPGRLPVAVVVTGGAGALAPAVQWATRSNHLELVAVEVAVRESDAGDLAPNARRIVAAVDALTAAGTLDEDVAVYVEPPRLYGARPSASWLTALDEVAAADHRLNLRTGGPDADAFPSSEELAVCIGAALDRELPFTCTGGLQHAVRHRDDTGLERHGFLNMLLATRASLDGAEPADVAAVLEERDAARLTGTVDPAALASARRWFTSFGSDGVSDPVRDLTALGLLEVP
jgi:hypothetical protein